jgi:phosphatidylglycerol:prolipoprotein diacylglycerol transferase
MWPYDITLGPLSLSGYGLMVMLGVFFGLLLVTYTAPRCGTTSKRAFDLGFWLVITGIIGSRIAYVIFHWTRFSLRPLDIIKYWEGGLMFHGGLFLGLALVLILSALKRINPLVLGDALAPGLALGQGLGRVGCLIAGCCHGFPAPSSFPFTLTFPIGSLAPSGLPLYPTQIMEGAGLFLITLILLLLIKFTRPAGLIMASYLTLAGLLRFVVDNFRGDYRGPRTYGLVPTSWSALFICAAGLILGLWLFQRMRKLRKIYAHKLETTVS